MDWCASGLAKLIYSGIILMASSPSGESVDLPLTCHPSPNLTSFAFRSSEVRRLLIDFDPYGGSDPLGMFPHFLKRLADVLAPRLSAVFRRLVTLGSFPACCDRLGGLSCQFWSTVLPFGDRLPIHTLDY